MRTKIVAGLGIAAFLVFISANLAFSAGEESPAMPLSEPDTQWLWGEVTNVDLSNKAISIKYLDYETDLEKELIVSYDDKTTYENIKSADEIKQKDTLSIDYALGPDGRNIAKNISLEKVDNAADTQEITDVETQKPVNPAEAQETMTPQEENTSAKIE